MTKEEFLIQYVLIRIGNPSINSNPDIYGIIGDALQAWELIRREDVHR